MEPRPPGQFNPRPLSDDALAKLNTVMDVEGALLRLLAPIATLHGGLSQGDVAAKANALLPRPMTFENAQKEQANAARRMDAAAAVSTAAALNLSVWSAAVVVSLSTSTGRSAALRQDVHLKKKISELEQVSAFVQRRLRA